MAYSYDPIMIATVRAWMAQIATANAGRDGSGTLGTLVVGGANGSRVEWIRARAQGTTTLGMIRLFLDNGAGQIRFLDEIPVTAVTPSASAVAWSGEKGTNDGSEYVFVPSGWLLKAATEKAETFDLIAIGGDY